MAYAIDSLAFARSRFGPPTAAAGGHDVRLGPAGERYQAFGVGRYGLHHSGLAKRQRPATAVMSTPGGTTISCTLTTQVARISCARSAFHDELDRRRARRLPALAEEPGAESAPGGQEAMSNCLRNLMILAVLAAAGCHDGRATPARSIVPNLELQPGIGEHPRAALLFDRITPRMPPGAFATRSDWPSIAGRYDAGEVTYYRERFVDYQSLSHPSWDYSYRRFETYREGTAYR